MFLISYALDPASWKASGFDLDEEESLLEAVVPGFIHQIRRALRQGVLQSYREEEDSLMTVRGRLRMPDQIRRRFGAFPPAEVTHDEFTEDIEENRLIKAALERLGRMRLRSATLHRYLRRRRRVAICCRVSTSVQDNDRQEGDLKDYAERADFEVVEVFKEPLSGIRKAKGKQPVERGRAMELAQARKIDAVLVTEMTWWGRSTQDLMDTLGEFASWDVSLIAQTGLTFDLSTPQGKVVANLMASLAEFEHDLGLLRASAQFTTARM